MTNRLSIDIVNHYMSYERQKIESNQMKNASSGTILYSTYASNHICIEVYEALLDVNDVQYDKIISDDNTKVSFLKKS